MKAGHQKDQDILELGILSPASHSLEKGEGLEMELLTSDASVTKTQIIPNARARASWQ